MERKFYYTTRRVGRSTGDGHRKFEVFVFEVRANMQGLAGLTQVHDDIFCTGGPSLRQWITDRLKNRMTDYPLNEGDTVSLIPIANAVENA